MKTLQVSGYMMKGIIIASITIIAIGIGGWYYITQVHTTRIGEIINNPRDYAGKEIVISGTVTERFSLMFIKYFNLQDSSGNIAVVSDKPLPAVGMRVRVRGEVNDGFSLGNQQTLVFLESSP